MTQRDVGVVFITVVAAVGILLVVLTLFGYWGFADRARHNATRDSIGVIHEPLTDNLRGGEGWQSGRMQRS